MPTKVKMITMPAQAVAFTMSSIIFRVYNGLLILSIGRSRGSRERK
jgi:hypothetical protein